MKFRCSGCQAVFSVPDEKIPEAKGLRVLCPKCRMPIELKNEAQAERTQEEATPKIPSPSAPPVEYTRDETALLDMVEEGARVALLCVTDTPRLQKIEPVLNQLDFTVVGASTMSVAVGKLHHNRYDLVILDEGFDQTGLAQNLLLRHIQLLPMHLRREFYLCLISPTLPTLDAREAFRLGVDMILNVNDLDKIKIILIRAIKDHHNLYKLFRDELKKKGQLD